MSAPTLVVGLGGFGCRVAAETRRLSHAVEESAGAEFLALDLDELPAALAKDFAPGEFWRLPASRVTDVLTHLDTRGEGLSWRSQLPWLPAGEGHELLDALEPGGARQYRSLGRVGYFVAARAIERQLELAVDRLRVAAGRQGLDDEVRVVLVTSAAGGTGSGMLLDVAHRLRRIEPRALLLLHLALPEIFLGLGDPERGKANTFATLAELLALRARLLPFRPCQTCGGTNSGVWQRELFSRVFVHGRAATGEGLAVSATARVIARAIASQFEAVLQRANRTAVGPWSRWREVSTEDPALGHCLSHGGAASVVVPPFSIADDCVIDFLLSDLERASAEAVAPAQPPPTPPPPALAPKDSPSPAPDLPVSVQLAAKACVAGLEQERQRVADELSRWIFSGKWKDVDRIDPTFRKDGKSSPRTLSAQGVATTFDLAQLTELPGFKEQLELLRRGGPQGQATGPGLGALSGDVESFQFQVEKLTKLRARYGWLRWFRMNITARLGHLGKLFAHPCFGQELAVALQDGLSQPVGEARGPASSGTASESHPPPPKAVQDWLLAELESERPGLLEWYRNLPADMTRAERREHLRSRLAGTEFATGLTDDAPLDGQELGPKLDALRAEAAATNPFLGRTPSCRQGETGFLLVPERLEELEESTRALQEFRNRQSHPVEILTTPSERLLLYTEDLLHPVTHLKHLEDYRQAYRNHGRRQALLHIDARFLENPEALYQQIGGPTPPSGAEAKRSPEVEAPPTKPRAARRPTARRPQG